MFNKCKFLFCFSNLKFHCFEEHKQKILLISIILVWLIPTTVIFLIKIISPLQIKTSLKQAEVRLLHTGIKFVSCHHHLPAPSISLFPAKPLSPPLSEKTATKKRLISNSTKEMLITKTMYFLVLPLSYLF